VPILLQTVTFAKFVGSLPINHQQIDLAGLHEMTTACSYIRWLIELPTHFPAVNWAPDYVGSVFHDPDMDRNTAPMQ